MDSFCRAISFIQQLGELLRDFPRVVEDVRQGCRFIRTISPLIPRGPFAASFLHKRPDLSRALAPFSNVPPQILINNLIDLRAGCKASIKTNRGKRRNLRIRIRICRITIGDIGWISQVCEVSQARLLRLSILEHVLYVPRECRRIDLLTSGFRQKVRFESDSLSLAVLQLLFNISCDCSAAFYATNNIRHARRTRVTKTRTFSGIRSCIILRNSDYCFGLRCEIMTRACTLT